MIRAIVCDIEGTTSDIRFVHEVLFPYAHAHLPAFFRAHGNLPAVQQIGQQVRTEAGEPEADDERVIELLLGWIAQDRKLTPLKQLQGMIWEQGYRNGDFQGHLYADAHDALRRWQAQGIRLYIFSSGSVQAQQLLFGHTAQGDLRDWFSGWFDTRTGAKREAAAYRRIAQAIGLPVAQVLFLSDTGEELDAARAAGMQTWQLLRDGTPPSAHRRARSFDEISLETADE